MTPETSGPEAVDAGVGGSERSLGLGSLRVIASGTAGMSALKIVYAALGFLTGVLLARTLGTSGFGLYSYALNWGVVLAVPASLGLDKFVVRQTAALHTVGDDRRVQSLVRSANRMGIFGSAVVVVFAAAATLWWQSTELRQTCWVALLMVPVLTLTKIRQAALSGMGRVVTAQLPDILVFPALLLLLLALVHRLLGGLTPLVAMGLAVTSAAATLGLGSALLTRSLPARLPSPPTPFQFPWRYSLIPLVATGTIQILQSSIDMLILGAVSTPSAVGLYTAAYRGSQLVLFFMYATIPVLSAAAARLHARGDHADLERVVVSTLRATLLISLPVVLILLLFGDWYLGLYGNQFLVARAALTMLTVAQFVNVAQGSPAWLLMMTGHETAAARSMGIGVVVNVILSALLIPVWHHEGAAASNAVSVIVTNVALGRDVRTRLGIACGVVRWPRGNR